MMEASSYAARPEPFETDEGRRRKPAFVTEYGARRCRVCRCSQPAFGFGPPLTRPDQQVWACGRHRAAVEAMLTPGKAPPPGGSEQQSLL